MGLYDHFRLLIPLDYRVLRAHGGLRQRFEVHGFLLLVHGSVDHCSEALLRSHPSGEGLLPIVMLLLVMFVLLFLLLVLVVIVQALFLFLFFISK